MYVLSLSLSAALFSFFPVGESFGLVLAIMLLCVPYAVNDLASYDQSLHRSLLQVKRCANVEDLYLSFSVTRDGM